MIRLALIIICLIAIWELDKKVVVLQKRVAKLEETLVAKCADDVKVSIYDEGTGKLTCIHKRDSYADANQYIDKRWAERMQKKK